MKTIEFFLVCRAVGKHGNVARVAIHVLALLTRHEDWDRAVAGIRREFSR
jgi:hypothetical protein